MEERKEMTLQLMHNEGVIEFYEDRLKRMAARIKELDKKCNRQQRHIVDLETQEVMNLVGKTPDDDR
jgi:hypothetical protein